MIDYVFRKFLLNMSHPQILDNLLKQMKLFKYKTITASIEVWCISSRTVRGKTNRKNQNKMQEKL